MNITCTPGYASDYATGHLYVSVTDLPYDQGTGNDRWANNKVVKYYVNGNLYHTSTTILASTNSTAYYIRNLNLGQAYTITVVCENLVSGGVRNATLSAGIPYPTDSGNITPLESDSNRITLRFGLEKRPYMRTYKIKANGAECLAGVIYANDDSVQEINFVVDQEGATYSVNMQVFAPDNTLTWSGSCIAQSGYSRDIDLRVMSEATPYSVKLWGRVYATASSPRTVKLFCDNEELEDYEMTVTSADEFFITVTDLLPGRLYSFYIQAIDLAGTISQTMSLAAYTLNSNVTCEVTDYNEYSATIGLTVEEVSEYAQTIKWCYYEPTGADIYQFGTTTLPANTTSSTAIIDSLRAGTSYIIRADLYIGDELTGTGSTMVTTSRMQGVIGTDTADNAVEPTTIKARVSSIRATTYARTVKWYSRRDGTSEWIYAGDTAIAAGTTDENKFRIQSLRFATLYDIKAEIYRGDNLLLELTYQERTLNADGTPDVLLWIDEVLASTYETSRYCAVKWSASDKYDWTGYKFYIDRGVISYGQTEPSVWYTADYWGSSGVIKEVYRDEEWSRVYHVGTNVKYGFRVKAVKGNDILYSKPFVLTLQVGTFTWDTPKVQGQPYSISAAEWLRFCKSIEAYVRAEAAGTGSENIPAMQETYSKVLPGKAFTAEMWNKAKDVLKNCHAEGMQNTFARHSMTYLENDIDVGGNVTAQMLNDIVTCVNTYQ